MNEENTYNVLCDALFILTSPALQVAKVLIRDDALGLEETGAASKQGPAHRSSERQAFVQDQLQAAG
jgi:hypothetical protein